MDIVDLYVTIVQVLGVHVHTVETVAKTKWETLVAVLTGTVIQTVTVVQYTMFQLLLDTFQKTAELFLMALIVTTATLSGQVWGSRDIYKH